MDRKRTMLLQTHLWLIAIIIAAAGLAVFSLASAQAKEKQVEEPNKSSMMMEKKMQKCMVRCVKDCHASMEDIASAKAAIKAAVEAIDKGDTAAAKSELKKAEELLTKAHKCMKENIEKMPCINNICPITGKPFDMMDRPKDCIRMHKGRKIGFCCPGCPSQWDKMTDAEKDAKLEEYKSPKE
jgi:ribosomal protein S20